VEAYIMARLAGRVAQLKVNRNLDSGASNDIMVAQQFAKIVVTQYGMEEDNFKNLFLMDGDLMSEKLANEINEKVAALIKECYDKTIKFIDEHWEILKNMAEYLIEKRIVTSDELDQFIPAELK
jgi:cell division protease FtsH